MNDSPLGEIPEPRPDLISVSPALTGSDLKRIRKELRMTQKEFAEYLGIPQGTVATWERRGTLTAPGAFIVRSVAERTAATRQQMKNLLSQGI